MEPNDIRDIFFTVICLIFISYQTYKIINNGKRDMWRMKCIIVLSFFAVYGAYINFSTIFGRIHAIIILIPLYIIWITYYIYGLYKKNRL